ncbi:hypothetical protein [Bradyrhizobium archetypum]|uniref:Uncharacterized protein n=1 Tax=Bradyrhizobium archetypum TaxID=2721160 RepID=A0A7Y4H5F6_9BRAD|nr:hypothetical protein [Bradyrhizobium archetypum]NOJ47738.1 hypothetical protein [Bradyrhizobium archetypum]
MFAHAGQLDGDGSSDSGALVTPGRGRWELRRRWAAAVRFENLKQKARGGILRAGFAIFAMMVLCR